MTLAGRGCWAAVRVGAAAWAACAVLAGCGAPARTAPGASLVAGPSGGAAGPTTMAAAASDEIVDAFLAFARSPSESFTVDISAQFKVGRHAIAFAGSGMRSGADAVESLTETVDGQATDEGLALVGGRAYGLTGAGWDPQPPENAPVLAQTLLSLGQALVLGDLGPDAASGGHRLQAMAGLSLYPYQMAAIADAHDLGDRLELVVDDAGLPVSAIYTRQVSGTVDGAAATASGSALFTFRNVGAELPIPAPSLVAGATLPPAAPTSAAPAPRWAAVPLAYAPLRLEVPGRPAVAAKTVPNRNIGPVEETDYRLALADGTTYTAIETQYPQSYIDARGVDAVAAEVVALEARNLGATVIGRRSLVGASQPGLDAVLATSSALYRLRVCVAGRDVVELGVVGAPAQVASADADRFLASLGAG